MSINMPIRQWVRERRENTERLAAQQPPGPEQDGWLEDAAYWLAIETQLDHRAEMLAALRAYEALDAQRANCEECSEFQEQAPEACGTCFPFADDARIKMRNALASIDACAPVRVN